MKRFSQTFVKYHGCGNCYLDETNMLIETGRKCVLVTNKPFWKRPIDSNNKIAKSTRNKLKTKPRANISYMKKHAKFVKNFSKQKYYDTYFSGDNESLDNYSESSDSDTESRSNIADNESTTGDTSETEQTLTDSELNKSESEQNSTKQNTGETLVIDVIIYNQTSNNKETKNKIVPSDI